MLFVKSSKLTHKAKKYEQSLHHTSHPKVDKFHPIFTVFSVNGTIQSRVFGHIWVLHVEPSSDSSRLRSTRRRRHGGKGRCLRRANEGSLSFPPKKVLRLCFRLWRKRRRSSISRCKSLWKLSGKKLFKLMLCMKIKLGVRGVHRRLHKK